MAKKPTKVKKGRVKAAKKPKARQKAKPVMGVRKTTQKTRAKKTKVRKPAPKKARVRASKKPKTAQKRPKARSKSKQKVSAERSTKPLLVIPKPLSYKTKTITDIISELEKSAEEVKAEIKQIAKKK